MFFKKILFFVVMLFLLLIFYLFLNHFHKNEKAMNMNFLSVIKKGDKAPKLVGITHWINSPPLTLNQLKGKVILIDFWAYSCINCIRILPYLEDWYDKYKNNGFIIIGVHKAEFEFERDLKNVKNAVRRFGIDYPIAMDNQDKTWQNYHNKYWPAHYLIDQKGIVQKVHVGEGDYLVIENEIRNLLGLSFISKTKIAKNTPLNITPEIYLGSERGNNYQSEIQLKINQVQEYDYEGTLDLNQVGIKGKWFVDSQFIQTKSDNCILDLNFIANRVYLVMKSIKPEFINILLDDKLLPDKYKTKDYNNLGKIIVQEPRMYDILDLKGADNKHKLTLKLPKDVILYAFTFGSGKE